MSKCDSCIRGNYYSESCHANYCDVKQDQAGNVIECARHTVKPKPTRYDRIMRNMTLLQMAEHLIVYDWREDDEGYIQTIYYADGNTRIFTSQDEALQAEIEWLQGVDE